MKIFVMKIIIKIYLHFEEIYHEKPNKKQHNQTQINIVTLQHNYDIL